MSSITVIVQPEVLDWIISKAHKEIVPDSVIETLDRWSTGEKIPTFAQIKTISKKIGIPFGYFFLQKPPQEECGIVEFRTVDSIHVQNPSRDLIDTLDQMTTIQSWMSEYNRENGNDRYSFVGSVHVQDGVRQVASLIRSELNIDQRWFLKSKTAAEAFKMFRTAIMNLGILVMMNGVVGSNTHRKLDVKEFRAFTLVDPYSPLIFINSRDVENGKLFSLLHELTHVLLGENSFYNDPYGIENSSAPNERFCNAVSAEILVPYDIFMQEWDKYNGNSESIIEQLNRVFVCSRFVLLRRALDSDRITRKEYNRLLALYLERIKELKQADKQTSGGNFYNTLNTRLDQRFIRALYASAESGRTQYRDVYRLTGTTGKTFHPKTLKYRMSPNTSA